MDPANTEQNESEPIITRDNESTPLSFENNSAPVLGQRTQDEVVSEPAADQTAESVTSESTAEPNTAEIIAAEHRRLAEQAELYRRQAEAQAAELEQLRQQAAVRQPRQQAQETGEQPDAADWKADVRKIVRESLRPVLDQVEESKQERIRSQQARDTEHYVNLADGFTRAIAKQTPATRDDAELTERIAAQIKREVQGFRAANPNAQVSTEMVQDRFKYLTAEYTWAQSRGAARSAVTAAERAPATKIPAVTSGRVAGPAKPKEVNYDNTSEVADLIGRTIRKHRAPKE